MIREFYDSTDEDDMESQYQVEPECLVLTRPDRDMHNRCCGGKAWCIKDICGIICAVLTWLLILYAEFVVMMVMLLPGVSTYPFYSYANIFVFQTLAFLAFASHLRTMFTDPAISEQVQLPGTVLRTAFTLLMTFSRVTFLGGIQMEEYVRKWRSEPSGSQTEHSKTPYNNEEGAR